LLDAPLEAYRAVLQELEGHHRWFSESLPLIASENVPSPAVREAMATDFGNRYAEGWPGERVYAGCIYIDRVELIAIDLAKRLFKAEFADVRPISGVTANLAVYSALTEPGDVMMALSIPSGGHISMGRRQFAGTAGLVHGLTVEYFAFDPENLTIDVDGTKERVRKLENEGKTPKLAMFGGSMILFPQPVRELADFLKGYNIIVCYDAAHVAGLIAGGVFQDPLREGAEIMTCSTHKTLFGPQGGMVVAYEKYGEGIKKAVFPGVTSNHHLHSVAGKAIAMAEFLEFGREYAAAVVANAKALAQALAELGLKVLGEKRGFTESHQVVLDITAQGDGGTLERELEKANIIVNRQLIPGDIKAGRHYTHPGGLRLGVQELTRLGMGRSEMQEVAELIKQVVVDRKDPAEVRRKVAELRGRFREVRYCFDPGEAYRYFNFRR
jgi:glycine hydroxymethyltransferase